MKIAFLNLYSGVNNRGAEGFVHELARKLAYKYDVHLFSGQAVIIAKVKNAVVDTLVVQPRHDLPAEFLARMRKRLFLDTPAVSVLVFSLKCFPALLKNKYDVLIPVNGFWQVIICKLASVFTGSKVLITGHSGPAWDERWNLYLKPDVFVATTEPTAVWARRVCPYTRVVVIPYGVEIQKYRKASPRRLFLQRPIILCPAAAVAYKRVDLAVKAVATLKRGSLIHLGEGPLLPEIASHGNKLLGKKRFLTRTCGYEEMPNYYASCDVVTLPSSGQENSPMVFLEAMAAGKIMVTTGTPRSRWILGQAGIFVDPENLTEYSQGIMKAINSNYRCVIDQEVKRFDFEEILRKYEALLQTLD